MFRTDHFLLRNVFLSFAAFLLAYSAPGAGKYVNLSLAIGLFTFCAYQLASWNPVIQNSTLSLRNFPGKKNLLLTLLAVVPALYLVPSIRFLVILLFAAVLTVLYYVQWPAGRFKNGLRSFLLIKNMLVAGIWTGFTYNLPAEYGRIDKTYWIARFVIIVIITLALDLRDIESDKKTGVKTLPVIYGYVAAKRLILLFACLSLILFSFPDYSGKAATLAGIAMCVLSVLFLNPKSGYWTYFLMLDGIMILHALFLLI